MFSPKTTAKLGVCLANRCKTAASETPENPHGLCAQHYNEWVAAERPELKAKAPKAAAAPGAELATVQALVEPVRTGAEQALAFAAAVPFDASFPAGFLGKDKPITGLEALGVIRETARQQFANLEEKRTSITKPMLEAKRKVDELFKPSTQLCEAVMRTCDDRLNGYARAQLAAVRNAAAQIQASPTDPTLLSVAHGNAAPLPAEVRAQVKFRVTVVDFAKVPDEFKLLNERAVQLLVDSKRGQVAIPGIEITEDVQVRTS